MSEIDDVIGNVGAPIRTGIFSWMEYTAEQVAQDFPAVGTYGGVIKLGELGLSSLNSASNATVDNIVPAIGEAAGGFLLVAGVVAAAGAVTTTAPFWAVAGLGLAAGWVGEQATKWAYGEIAQHAPTIYNDLNADIHSVGTAMSNYVTEVSSDIGVLVAQASQAINGLSTTAPNYANQVTGNLDNLISNEISSLATAGQTFLSAFGLNTTNAAASMSTDLGTVGSWISQASTTLLADPSPSSAQQQQDFINYVATNASGASTDFASLMQSYADDLQNVTSTLADGVTFAPNSTTGGFSFSAPFDSQPGDTVTDTYDQSLTPVSQNVETATGKSVITDTAPDGSVTATEYAGLNGIGAIIEIDQENTDGTSQITTNNPGGSTTTAYSGPNGTGSITGIDIESPTSSIVSQVGDITYDYNGTGMSGVVTYNDFTNTVETAIFSGGSHTYYGGSLYGIGEVFQIDNSLRPTFWLIGDLYTTDGLGHAGISTYNGPPAEQYEYTGTPFEFYQNLDATNTWTLVSLTTAVTISPLAGQTQLLSDVLTNPQLTTQGSLQYLTINGPGAVEVTGAATVPTVVINGGGNLLLQGGSLNTDPITVNAGGNITGYGLIAGDETVNGNVTAEGGTLDITGNVNGSGTLGIASGASLQLEGTVTATELLIFNAGGSESLILGASADVLALVNGFGAGDSIALEGQQVTTAVYNASTDVLTFTGSGGATYTLTLAGTYQQSDFGITSGEIVFPETIHDPGPTANNGSVTEGHGKTVDLSALINGLITPGIVGDTETLTSVSAAHGNAVLGPSNTVTYTAPATGPDTITYTVGDQYGDTATGNVAVTVDPGPTANNGSVTEGHGKTVDLSALINGLITPGIAGDTETLTSVSAAHGNAALGPSNTVTYTAPATGPDTITYTVDDQYGDTATGNVAVTVSPPAGQTFTLTTGPDVVSGAAGDNTVTATSGTLTPGDLIDGGGGTNALILSGAGTFNLRAPTTLTDIQTINAQEGQAAYATGGQSFAAQNQIVYLRDGLNATVDVSAATLNPSNPKPATITIVGANNGDIINLASGNDVVTVGSTAETVNLGGGNDTIMVSSATIGSTIQNGTGQDTLDATGGGSMAMGSNITDIGTVLLAPAATAYHFSANAISGLTVNDSSTGLDTIQAGGLGQTLTGDGAGKATMMGFSGGGTTFKNTATAFQGDTIGNFSAPNDAIDVTNIGFVNVQTPTFVEDGSNAFGTLTVTDGVHTAAIKLLGQFMAQGFQTASDGGAGTQITYPPVQQQSLLAPAH